jgi:hypothetical protein
MAGRQIFSGRRGGLNNTDPIGLESGPAGEWPTLKRGPQNPDPLDMSTSHFFLLIETDPALTEIPAAQLWWGSRSSRSVSPIWMKPSKSSSSSERE